MLLEGNNCLTSWESEDGSEQLNYFQQNRLRQRHIAEEEPSELLKCSFPTHRISYVDQFTMGLLHKEWQLKIKREAEAIFFS